MWTKIKLILLAMCMGLCLCGCTTIDAQPTSIETVKLVIDPVLLEPVPPLIYLKWIKETPLERLFSLGVYAIIAL